MTGLAEATDIQRLAFGPIAEGRDVFGRSRTGTGKSLAFLLPAMTRFADYSASQGPLDVSIVILSPIKELSEQLASVATKLASSGLRGAGGRPFAVRSVIGKQGCAELSQGKPCDLLVATPGVASAKKGGGLAKLLMTDAAARARLKNVRTLVLDEGDALTDGGFLGAIKEIASHMKRAATGPGRLQLLVFSATLPTELQDSPVMASRKTTLFVADTVGHGHKAVGNNVTQRVVVADSAHQVAVLTTIAREHIAAASKLSGGSETEDTAFLKLLEAQLKKTPAKFADFGMPKELSAALVGFATPKEKRPSAGSWKILVFVGSALYTDLVHEALGGLLKGDARGGVHKIHGQLSPGQRKKSSDAFRVQERSVLVSTDASSRGVDYDGLTLVVQLGFTSRSEFLQRAGRVGRAGATGHAVAVLDTVEAGVVMRKTCKNTEEGCIGDMLASGALSINKGVFKFDKAVFGPADAAKLKGVKAARVYSTWLGGIASTWKRLKIPPKDVLDWAKRFAGGLGVKYDEAKVKDKLKIK